MEKYLYVLLISLLSVSCSLTNNRENTITFTPDTISNLKNPYMGWTLYTEGRGWHKDGKESWEIQDEAAKKYAGVFYIRWKWDEIEPEEGKYAWDHDSIFINLVNGAKERGLRLAFRIFTHTGTPQYVLDKAETFEQWGKKTPYADDPVFLEKYENVSFFSYIIIIMHIKDSAIKNINILYFLLYKTYIKNTINVIKTPINESPNITAIENKAIQKNLFLHL